MRRFDFDLKMSHKGFILILVPLLFQLVLLIVLSVQLQKAEAEVQRQIRAKAIISQANALSKLFYDAGVAMGGYSITKSPLFGDRYAKICKEIPVDLTELKNLVGNDPVQKSRLLRLEVIIKDGLKILDEAKKAIDDNRVDVAQFRARHMYKQIRQLADQLQDELRKTTEGERQIVLLSPEEQVHSRTIIKRSLITGLVLNFVIAFGLLYSTLANKPSRTRFLPQVDPTSEAEPPNEADEQRGDGPLTLVEASSVSRCNTRPKRLDLSRAINSPRLAGQKRLPRRLRFRQQARRAS